MLEKKIMTEKKNSMKKKDLEIDIEENLNIDKEIVNKTSSKVLNTLLFTNQLKTDINLSIRNSLNLRGSINSSNKNQGLFSDNKLYTKKELRKSLNGYFNLQKRASILNFREDLTSSSITNKNSGNNNTSNNLNLSDKKKKNNKQNYIEYNDLYFEDDMFIPESSSFPNEYEEDFFLRLQFIEDNDYNEDIVDYSLRYNSISYKYNHRDNIHLKYFNNGNNINSLNQIYEKKDSNNFKIDSLFIDEKEIIGKNILYLDNPKNTNNIKTISKNNSKAKNQNQNEINNDNIKNDKNENNISYISLDLLLQKIALENFRKKNPYIYNSFLQQFIYFLPLEIFIKKIINAFTYYNDNKIKVNSSDLVYLLNDIIFRNYEEIKLNENLIEYLNNFYTKIKNIKFDYNKVNQELITIDYLLFKNYYSSNGKDKFIGNISSLSKMGKSKTQQIFLKIKNNPEPKKEEKKIKIIIREKKHNFNYFYIFDFAKEEIAAYLTCESYELLSNIQENELFNKNFARKNRNVKAPNVMKLIERYDKLILFIIEDICSYDSKADRIEIIEKWVRIANVCKDYKNFNDLIMLNDLFYNYLLKIKLKLTWKKLSKKSLEYMKKLKIVCSSNWCYLNIRKEIFKCKGKFYVPYLGILLKELMNMEESMKYTINNNININKLDKTNKIIKNFFEFKNQKLPFEKPKHLEILANIQPKNEEEIETLIKQIEPKLLIFAEKNNKKRRTQSDESFYNKN